VNKIDVNLKDFQLCSEWVSHEDEFYVEDQATGRAYASTAYGIQLKDSDIRGMCLFTSFGVLPALTCIVNLVARVVILISGYPFWHGLDTAPYSFKERLIDTGRHLAALLATPLLFVALECAAIFGVIHPLNGRKLYASIERLSFLFVGLPSFQPMFLSHPILDVCTLEPYENSLQKLFKDTVEPEYGAFNKVLEEISDKLRDGSLNEAERKEANEMIDCIRRLKEGDIRMLEKWKEIQAQVDTVQHTEANKTGYTSEKWEEYEKELFSPENIKKLNERMEKWRKKHRPDDPSLSRELVEVTEVPSLDKTSGTATQSECYEDYDKHFEREQETNSSKEYSKYGALLFKTPQGKTVYMEYSSTACVGHLRAFLHFNYGYPLSMIIVFAGKALQDDEVFSQNNGRSDTLNLGLLRTS